MDTLSELVWTSVCRGRVGAFKGPGQCEGGTGWEDPIHTGCVSRLRLLDTVMLLHRGELLCVWNTRCCQGVSLDWGLRVGGKVGGPSVAHDTAVWWGSPYNNVCLCDESGDDEAVWSGRLHKTEDHDVE